MSLASPTRSLIGPNAKGFATLSDNKTYPMRVEYISPGNMLHGERLDNGQQVQVHASSFTMSQSIPSIFREHVFHTMAPFWESAIASFPQAIVINDERWSAETLMRKLRESRQAKQRYGWVDSLIDETKWKELSPRLHIRLVVSHDQTLVSIGPEEPTEYRAFEAVVTNRNDIFVRCPDTPTLEKFCRCVEAGIFSPTPRYVIYGLTDDQVTDLEARYDIGFVKRPDGHSWEVVS
ncbi:MAG: hypothetical protein KGL39_08510 [Patescibacteria group bacterium]|nr:hypothetical protein [Patescibacteria group bacterium]